MLKQRGVWEIITTSLPKEGGDFVGAVGLQEVGAKVLGVWMKKEARSLKKTYF